MTLTGVEISQEATKLLATLEPDYVRLSYEPEVEFKFVMCDIVGFKAVVKHMNVVDVANGGSLFYEGKKSLSEKVQEKDTTNLVRIMSMALWYYQV